MAMEKLLNMPPTGSWQQLTELAGPCRSMDLKLNKKKLRLRLDQVTYMGHSLTSEELRPDPMKVEAIASMPRPDDKKAVQCLLGCVNYLSRLMPTISGVSEPLRKLTEKNVMFVWESQQEDAFQTIKNMNSSTPVLILWYSQWNHPPMRRIRVWPGSFASSEQAACVCGYQGHCQLWSADVHK